MDFDDKKLSNIQKMKMESDQFKINSIANQETQLIEKEKISCKKGY